MLLKDRFSSLPSSTSEFYIPVEHGDSSSSASRVLPNFQRLIFNLQVRNHYFLNIQANKCPIEIFSSWNL